MKLRNILALCCTIILNLISCSKDQSPIKDTLSGSEWTWSDESSSDKFREVTVKLKFTSDTEGVALAEFYIEDGGHMRKKEDRLDFTYELKGSLITTSSTRFDEKEKKNVTSRVIGTLDREKGTIEFRDTKDGKVGSYIYHRSK